MSGAEHIQPHGRLGRKPAGLCKGVGVVRTPRGDAAPGGALIVSAARSWQSARLAVGEARQLFIIITPGLSANMKTKRQSRLSIRSEEPVREQRTCWARYAQGIVSG